jgi:peptidoglycan/xylan/chitin deacetylase (PgdA/CDA1 family)
VWPGDAKIAMSIGLAFEAFQFQSQYSHAAEKGKVNYFSISYADYGWKSGVWRLLDLLDDVGLRASMSTNGLAAERQPGAVRAVAGAGDEIVGHGWVNDILMKDDDPEGELAEIRRCTRALTEAASVQPCAEVRVLLGARTFSARATAVAGPKRLQGVLRASFWSALTRGPAYCWRTSPRG